jgi:myo-inositol-1(or 4)-monophosphatase
MKNYLRFSIDLAREVGRDVLLKHYDSFQRRKYKSLTDFKTQVDDLADRLIRQRISRVFPAHNIMSEEGEQINRGSEYTWVCDPLDGTLPYTRRISDAFSVSIGLVKGTTPVLGVIYFPKSKKLYHAEDGKGAFLNREKIKISGEKDINRSLVGFEIGKETKSFQRVSALRHLDKLLSSEGVGYFFTNGSFTQTSSLCASGNLDAVIGVHPEPWDVVAAVVINREAGARVTTLEDRDWSLGDETVLMANPIIHKKILSLLKS